MSESRIITDKAFAMEEITKMMDAYFRWRTIGMPGARSWYGQALAAASHHEGLEAKEYTKAQIESCRLAQEEKK